GALPARRTTLWGGSFCAPHLWGPSGGGAPAAPPPPPAGTSGGAGPPATGAPGPATRRAAPPAAESNGLSSSHSLASFWPNVSWIWMGLRYLRVATSSFTRQPAYVGKYTSTCAPVVWL